MSKRRQLSDLDVIYGQDFQEAGRTSPPEDAREAAEIAEDYELKVGDRFATGGYADIHRATMIRPGGTDHCEVAVKVLRHYGTALSPEEYEQRLLRIDIRLGREIDVWKRLRHRHITPLLAYVKRASKMIPNGGAALISPYRENANLRTYLSKNPNADKLLLLQQACEGLNYMHTFQPPIAHLDLKPENILINDNLEAELCDYGLAKSLEDVFTGYTTSIFGVAGTVVYLAPEALLGEPQTTASDIYAMGGVILYVLSGIPPWGSKHSFRVLMRVLNNESPTREEHTISAYDTPMVDEIWILMQRCWSFRPGERPKSLEMLENLTDWHSRTSTQKDNAVDHGSAVVQPHREDIPSTSRDKAKLSLHSEDDEMADHGDLTPTIEQFLEAIQLNFRPPDRPGHDVPLHGPWQAPMTPYDRDNNPNDLSATVELSREAFDLLPPDHPERAASLHGLSQSLMVRYDRDNNPNDLKAAITYFREALDLRPPGHPERAVSLHGLAQTFTARYDRDNDPSNLSVAITYFREALNLRPPGHPERAVSLHGLAQSLMARYNRDNDPNDLGSTIEYFWEVVELRPPGHSRRDMSLHELARALIVRYNRDHNPKDLWAAVRCFQEVVDLRPPGHPERGRSLYELARALTARYYGNLDLNDLSAAVQHFRAALDLHPPGHPEREILLHELASALTARYIRDRNPDDLSSTVEYILEVVDLRPPGHPGRDSSLHELARVLVTRYHRNSNLKDLSAAIEYFHEVVRLRYPVYPGRAKALLELAKALLFRYCDTRDSEDLSAAINHFQYNYPKFKAISYNRSKMEVKSRVVYRFLEESRHTFEEHGHTWLWDSARRRQLDKIYLGRPMSFRATSLHMALAEYLLKEDSDALDNVKLIFDIVDAVAHLWGSGVYLPGTLYSSMYFDTTRRTLIVGDFSESSLPNRAAVLTKKLFVTGSRAMPENEIPENEALLRLLRGAFGIIYSITSAYLLTCIEVQQDGRRSHSIWLWHKRASKKMQNQGSSTDSLQPTSGLGWYQALADLKGNVCQAISRSSLPLVLASKAHEIVARHYGFEEYPDATGWTALVLKLRREVEEQLVIQPPVTVLFHAPSEATIEADRRLVTSPTLLHHDTVIRRIVGGTAPSTVLLIRNRLLRSNGWPSDLFEASVEGSRVAVKIITLPNNDVVKWCNHYNSDVASRLDPSRALVCEVRATEDLQLCLLNPWHSGVTLEQYLSLNEDPEPKHLILQLGAALHYLHCEIPGGPIKHSSINPHKVIVENGRVMLKDVGIVAALEAAFPNADVGHVDRLRWMAPEIFNGDGYTLASDVYALALVILCGRLPYPRSRSLATIILAQRKGGMPDLREFPQVEQPLADLLRRCWSFNSNERPQMAVLYPELGRIVEGHLHATPTLRSSEGLTGKIRLVSDKPA